MGLILAGGRSTRMGGRDKALVLLDGEPLVQHLARRLRPQVDILAINSNADPAVYARLDLAVLADRLPDFPGPLAGVHAGLSTWPDALLVTVAVDLPFPPPDLVARLRAHLGDHACAYASDGTRHALAILWAPGGAGRVADYLERGGRRVDEFLAACGTPVLFDRPQDRGLFDNLNTPEDLARAARETLRR